MKIIIAPNAGACPGVKKALKVVETALEQCRNHIYCLHDIVHNRQVMEKLCLLGLQKAESLNSLTAGDNLIINTHGTGRSTYQEAFSKGINIIDTTCSNVRHVQKLAGDLASDNRRLIVAGERNHPEVEGIIAWCKSPSFVVKDIDEIISLDIKAEDKIALISQTTFSLKRFLEIGRYLQRHFRHLKIYQTICHATELRQKGISKIADQVEVFWVIGSHQSANTKSLLEIAQYYYSDSCLIEDLDEIDIDSLHGINTLGITAGASTPDWVINAVLKRIKDLSNEHVIHMGSIDKHDYYL
jgi:(E)-4-hydroxy-3-methyl-but-2-enyl pyrophosphate reductase